MAGHSHWAGIKHKKDRVDKIRSKIFSRLSKEITVAAKLGDKDPNMNPRLRSAIQSARSANMPKVNITRAIEKSNNLEGNDYESIRYEGFGPFNIACIVETLTDNKNRTASSLRSIFQKNGGTLGDQGSASFNFQQVGVIKFNKSEIKENKIYELAIEIEADELVNRDNLYEIHCKKNNLYKIKKKLEANINNFISTDIEWLPLNKVDIIEKKKIEFYRFLNILEDNDDIQRVFTNLK
tara:strand:+ start:2146 stop:2859 length:714 start_codon:yes stop_codon:yes gene_type:complete